MSEVISYAITLILGGGLAKGIESLVRALAESREKKSLAASVGAKTPAEIESLSVTTMASALTSAQSQIEALTEARSQDQRFYENRIGVIEKERDDDRAYYTGRIVELTEQLQHVRQEMESMERTLAELLAETHPKHEEGG